MYNNITNIVYNDDNIIINYKKGGHIHPNIIQYIYNINNTISLKNKYNIKINIIDSNNLEIFILFPIISIEDHSDIIISDNNDIQTIIYYIDSI